MSSSSEFAAIAMREVVVFVDREVICIVHTVSIYGIPSGKVEVGGLQRKYDAVVEVDQLRNESSAESSAESSIIYTHTHKIDLDEYLHLAKLSAWIDILFYEQQG